MDYENAEDWQQSLTEFFSHFEGLFKRSESRQMARDYMRGLLADIKRKNCWQIAETMGLADPQALQRLLYEAKWDADAICQKYRGLVVSELGYKPGIGVIDESGFEKKGQQSAGVQRQWCGRLGKVENCQVGVFLGYVAPLGHAFLDRELYLPQSWCEDAQGREKARIPVSVKFQTKPQLALRMLERAWAEGIAMQWVVGDSVYGNSPDLRNSIDYSGRYYVMGIPSSNRVSPMGGDATISVEALAQSLATKDWIRMAFGLGEKGLQFYDWAVVRVIAPTDTIGEQWLLFRRSVGSKVETTYALSNAPEDTALEDLVAVALARHPIEQLLQEAKSEAGLADYEVRYWHSWYRHITLSLMAHTWLTLMRHRQREKKSLTRMDELQFG
jgi:SRSO17 transposase